MCIVDVHVGQCCIEDDTCRTISAAKMLKLKPLQFQNSEKMPLQFPCLALWPAGAEAHLTPGIHTAACKPQVCLQLKNSVQLETNRPVIALAAQPQ